MIKIESLKSQFEQEVSSIHIPLSELELETGATPHMRNFTK